MKASRITALGLVAAAALWIASGYIIPREHSDSSAAVRPGDSATQKLFRVSVLETAMTPYSRKLSLSGRTEAVRKVMLIARTGGELTELRVRRGDRVEKGDVIAVLSDDARKAQVAQARALLAQRKEELEAKRKLIQLNAIPRLELSNLEAQFKAAEAAMAAAEAELDRGIVRAPWAGIITDVPSEVGGAAFSMAGKEIARLVSLNPMLAVVEVSERNLAGVTVGAMAEVRTVSGQPAKGRIRYVSKSASDTTRTYRVEVEIDNPDGVIPDGISVDVTLPFAPVEATKIPRSALTFSSAGELGVRNVDANGVVQFTAVTVVDDQQAFIWVTGIPNQTRVIVTGQDFVREGQRVEPVADKSATAQR
jgi:multidrug efflux system membrane fusion protein